MHNPLKLLSFRLPWQSNKPQHILAHKELVAVEEDPRDVAQDEDKDDADKDERKIDLSNYYYYHHYLAKGMLFIIIIQQKVRS